MQALLLDVIWEILCLIASAVTDGGRGKINFFNKRSGSTFYCGLEEKVQFYHFSISKRVENLSYNKTKANWIDQPLIRFLVLNTV